jgi:hypothetical protein
MRIPVLAIQLVPIVVLLLPLIEAVGFTAYWRRSVSSPWLYGLLGTLLAYAVAVAVVFAVEKLVPPRSTVIMSAAPVWRAEAPKPSQTQAPKVVQSSSVPTFEPLTPGWFGLLATILVLCGFALWALTFAFRGSQA